MHCPYKLSVLQRNSNIQVPKMHFSNFLSHLTVAQSPSPNVCTTLIKYKWICIPICETHYDQTVPCLHGVSVQINLFKQYQVFYFQSLSFSLTDQYTYTHILCIFNQEEINCIRGTKQSIIYQPDFLKNFHTFESFPVM